MKLIHKTNEFYSMKPVQIVNIQNDMNQAQWINTIHKITLNQTINTIQIVNE